MGSVRTWKAAAFPPLVGASPPMRMRASTHRIQGCGASSSCPDSELPSDASSRPQPACRRARVFLVDGTDGNPPGPDQILKLRAFRECPRQKYSTPSLPLTIPELVTALRDFRIDYFSCMALQGLQLR